MKTPKKDPKQAQRERMREWRRSPAGKRATVIRTRTAAKAASWVIRNHHDVWTALSAQEAAKYDAGHPDDGPDGSR